MISFFLGIVLLGGVIAPIQALVVKLRSTLTLSASQQEPAEPISTGTKSDKDEIGWQGLVVWLLIGPLVGSYFLYNLGQSVHADFNDKVTLSDSGFTSDVWMGFELHRQQYSFDDIQVIHARHTRRRSGKYGVPRKSYATVSLKSGHQEEIRVNEVLTSAWPEIARKAVAKGVPIEGDF